MAGDYWDQIAVRVYGSEIYTPILQRNNPAFAGVVEFEAKVVLYCPQVQITSSVGNQPWSSSYYTPTT